jgi:hypothetical protein
MTSFYLETSEDFHYMKDQYIMKKYNGTYVIPEPMIFNSIDPNTLVCVIKKFNLLRDFAITIGSQNELDRIKLENGTKVWISLPPNQQLEGRV